MANASYSKQARLADRIRALFTTRDFIFHDGRDLKRFSIAGRTQAVVACVGAVTVLFSGYGVAQAMVGAISVSGVAGKDTSPQAQMAEMAKQVQKMQDDVEAAKASVKAHAARVEHNQALISAALTGNADRAKINQPIPDAANKTSAIAEEVLAPLRKLESRQLALAGKAQAVLNARYSQTAAKIRGLGLDPQRFEGGFPIVQGGMGGPLEAADGDGGDTAAADADAQFRSLFLTWQKLDNLEQTVISIPSLQPVENITFSSTFGVRSDPFRGSAAMHPGVDIPGALGTPIYATADGVVARAGRVGGYGNMVEISHGHGISTRYGHMSKILIGENTKVKRGQLIGLMGSTGRSTGSHLHYEVRVDGKAVNPVPFLQNGGYLAAIQQKGAMGGPAAD
ncbi:M23 family metallopeptidase [Sphingomonas sp.]|uniref:M23 family metallopeptidase n=1 Tax=Sphingomonas sp. TaxID=28214 RepID=UPI001B08F4F0|nr:M23 family metallopeptidase [Sphingomonas sp.]MBO9714305.1 M23 family metallopeptidase [Sphingomonas sp.]